MTMKMIRNSYLSVVNNVLWEHSHNHSFMHCPWLLSPASALLSPYSRLCGGQSLKYLLSSPLQNNVC